VNGDFDRLLRGVVADLASEGRPVDLSRPALRAARRIRTRRVVAATVSALVLLIGLSVAVIRTGGTDRSEPPTGRNPSPDTTESSAQPWPTATVPHSKERRPVLLPDWEVRGLPTADGVLVFDDAQKRYRPVRVPGGVASPDGKYVASLAAGRLRIHTVASGRDVPFDLPPGAHPDAVPAWSPDSTKVAYVAAEAGTTIVIIVDPVRETHVRSTPVPCATSCILRLQTEAAFVFHGDSFTALSPTSGTVVAAQPQPLSDPCPQRRSYRYDRSHLSADALDLVDSPADVWACLVAGTLEIRTATGKRIETTGIPTEVDGYRVEPDPARLTLYHWPGCTPDEDC
jgi:hypothetical protein